MAESLNKSGFHFAYWSNFPFWNFRKWAASLLSMNLISIYLIYHTRVLQVFEVIEIQVVFMQGEIHFHISSAVTVFREPLWLGDRLSGVLRQTAAWKLREALDSCLLSSQSSLFTHLLRIAWSSLQNRWNRFSTICFHLNSQFSTVTSHKSPFAIKYQNTVKMLFAGKRLCNGLLFELLPIANSHEFCYLQLQIAKPSWMAIWSWSWVLSGLSSSTTLSPCPCGMMRMTRRLRSWHPSSACLAGYRTRCPSCPSTTSIVTGGMAKPSEPWSTTVPQVRRL